jgi:hypothetical protein
MTNLYQDSWFTFRFADARSIPRFQGDGVEACRQVSVIKIGPGIGERLGLVTMAAAGESGLNIRQAMRSLLLLQNRPAKILDDLTDPAVCHIDSFPGVLLLLYLITARKVAFDTLI